MRGWTIEDLQCTCAKTSQYRYNIPALGRWGGCQLEAPNTGVLRLQIFGRERAGISAVWCTSAVEGGQGDRSYSTAINI